MSGEGKDRENEIFEQYQDMLFRIAFSNVKNRADAEDAVQETFVRFLKTRPEFQSSDHEKAWLIRTVVHICYDILKSAWNKKTIGMDEVNPEKTTCFLLPFLKEDETLKAVMELPVLYRNVIYLFYYEDYSIKELSVILNEKESTIKTRLRRGREQVRQILEREEFS